MEKRKHKLKEQLEDEQNVYHVLLCCTIIMKIYEISQKTTSFFFYLNFTPHLITFVLKLWKISPQPKTFL